MLNAVNRSVRIAGVNGVYGRLTAITQPDIFVRGFASGKFDEAQAKLKTLKEEPDNDVKLKIYALFKQVSWFEIFKHFFDCYVDVF